MTFLMSRSTIWCNRPLCQGRIDAPRFELEPKVHQTFVQNQLHHASNNLSIYVNRNYETVREALKERIPEVHAKLAKLVRLVQSLVFAYRKEA